MRAPDFAALATSSWPIFAFRFAKVDGAAVVVGGVEIEGAGAVCFGTEAIAVLQK